MCSSDLFSCNLNQISRRRRNRFGFVGRAFDLPIQRQLDRLALRLTVDPFLFNRDFNLRLNVLVRDGITVDIPNQRDRTVDRRLVVLQRRLVRAFAVFLDRVNDPRPVWIDRR